MRNISRGFGESLRVGELLAGKRVATGIAQDEAIGGIDNDPAAVYEHFGDDVFSHHVGINEKQAAHGKFPVLLG